MLNKKHLIIGYYGENFGDNLMLKSLIELYKKNNYDYSILTFANFKDSEIIKFIGADKINKINFYNFSQEINSCSDVVWGGGTCFFDKKGLGGIKYMLFSKFLFNKKVKYFSIGVDELKSLKTKIVLFLACFLSNSIFLRDIKSFNRTNKYTYFLFENKVFQTFDLVYDHTFVPECSPKYNSEILIACRNIDEYFENAEQLLSDLIVEIVSNVLNLETRINILVVDRTVDFNDSRFIYDELSSKGYNCTLLKDRTYKETCNYIKGSKFIITGRLHVGFVSLLYNIPFSILNYSSKIEAFTEENFITENLVNYSNLSNLFSTKRIVKNLNTDLLLKKSLNISHQFKKMLVS